MGGHEAEPSASAGEGDANPTPAPEPEKSPEKDPPEHEGLFLHPDPYKTLARISKSSSPLSRGDKEEEEEDAVDRASSVGTGLLDVARRVMGGARFEAIHSRIGLRGGGGGARGGRRGGGGGGGVWSIAAAVGLMGILMYMRRRDRQERDLLLLLIKEKEQMIGQLLHQIALMNEVSTIRKS
uniref:Uncharacterized protein n=1 Tax=Ananas comosus var. bracteatus TaxID=296719 RepID=A0A6V7Q4Q5_ANACO|nr:unnamed protein product [Ananas comosus var. bracteatus]